MTHNINSRSRQLIQICVYIFLASSYKSSSNEKFAIYEAKEIQCSRCNTETNYELVSSGGY